MKLGWTTFGAVLALAAPAVAAPVRERLVMQPYPGAPWTMITNKNTPRGFYHEHIPATQTVADFADILTDQDFPNLRGYDPAAYLRNVFAGIPNVCSGVRVAGPTSRTEGGYAVAYGQVYCGQQNGKPYGVTIFYKAVGGREALYVISREFHTPTSANGAMLSFPPGHEADAMALLKAQAAADDYLAKRVYVCGAPSTDARCRR